MDNDTPIQKQSWKEFRNTGLLWFINRLLHLFGWAIVVELDSAEIKEVYPARTVFRGFCPDRETEGFKAVSKYLKENIFTLEQECFEVREIELTTNEPEIKFEVGKPQSTTTPTAYSKKQKRKRSR